MRRGYRTEHFNVRPLETSYGIAFESDSHPNQYYRDGGHATNNHHTYYLPVVAKTTTTRSTVDFPPHQHPNLHHDQRRDHWPGSTDRVISPQQHPNLTHDQGRDRWPEITNHRVISAEQDNHGNQYQHGDQHAKGTGDYLDYVSRLEKMPSIYGTAPQVQNKNAMQDKQVTYEEYVTSDEDYDSDAQEMVKTKITTRVEKRAVNW